MAPAFQFCTTCGYDFEGLDNPEFCPECGSRPDQLARDLARCWYEWRTARTIVGFLQRPFPPRVTAARIGRERVGYQHVALPLRRSLHSWVVYVSDVGVVVYSYTLGDPQLEHLIAEEEALNKLDVSVIVHGDTDRRDIDHSELLDRIWQQICPTARKMHRSQRYLFK